MGGGIGGCLGKGQVACEKKRMRQEKVVMKVGLINSSIFGELHTKKVKIIILRSTFSVCTEEYVCMYGVYVYVSDIHSKSTDRNRPNVTIHIIIS